MPITTCTVHTNCHTFRNEATIMAELKSLKDLTNTKATATTRTSAGLVTDYPMH